MKNFCILVSLLCLQCCSKLFVRRKLSHKKKIKPKQPKIDILNIGIFIFKGEWKSQKNLQSKYIDSQKGMIYYAFNQEYSPQNGNSFKFIFEFYKGYYKDENFILGKVDIPIKNGKEMELKTSTQGQIKKYKEFDTQVQIDECDFEVSVYILDSEGKQQNIDFQDINNMQIQGSIKSVKCGLEFTFDGSKNQTEFLSVLSFLFINILAIAINLMPIIHSFRSRDFTYLKNIQETVFLMNINTDFIFISINTGFSMRIAIDYFEYMAILTLYLMFSMVIKMKLLLIIFQTRITSENFEIERIQKLKYQFMVKFMILTISSLFLSFFLAINYYFLIFAMCYPIIQILHNSCNLLKKDCFDPIIHIQFFLPQIIFPISLRGLPFNYLQINKDLNFTLIMILLPSISLLVMYLQSKLGASFFLPKILRPNYYNYDRKTELMEEEEVNCPICFEDLTLSTDNESMMSDSFMQTPCGHNFHPNCLKQWMQHKFLCPCCRQKIPPYDE